MRATVRAAMGAGLSALFLCSGTPGASAVTHTLVTPTTVTADCAVLGPQGPGWATIDNACDFDITASVTLTYGPPPACIDIEGGGSRLIFWGTEAEASNASEC
ncbi:hypothetical protein OG948_55690 (plasmid) [Embleya sp. NBC_00888]|uniref:hypothetical protein n=1 Tax=Embleya sp. NBC_00888 TaxID=2975960 RepID=UPI002F915EC7|nr:hypothetical protein OG948_55690 [Embleya sp. NBC_00888]